MTYSVWAEPRSCCRGCRWISFHRCPISSRRHCKGSKGKTKTQNGLSHKKKGFLMLVLHLSIFFCLPLIYCGALLPFALIESAKSRQVHLFCNIPKVCNQFSALDLCHRADVMETSVSYRPQRGGAELWKSLRRVPSSGQRSTSSPSLWQRHAGKWSQTTNEQFANTFFCSWPCKYASFSAEICAFDLEAKISIKMSSFVPGPCNSTWGVHHN